jgi:hypothetical protein
MSVPKPGSKYSALFEYLRRQAGPVVVLRMTEVERITGEPLPASARRSAAFWSNRRDGWQSSAWMAAGYRVTRADGRRVRFERPPARRPLRKSAGEARWDGEAVRALRDHLELNQEQLADLLGVRQQTISEWETGTYAPSRGRSKHLDLVAERSGFEYGASSRSK